MSRLIFEALRRLLVFVTGHGYDRSTVVNNLHHRFAFRLHRLLPRFGIRSIQQVRVPKLPNVSMYVLAEDGGVGHQLLMYKQYEPFETSLIRKYVSSGMTVYNVGANLGYYVLHLAEAVGPSGHVFAFEPAPNNLTLLRRTVAESPFSHITIVEAAVGKEVGSSLLSLSSTNSGDHQLMASANRETIDVELTTLDAFCAEGNSLPDVLILDVQGSELDVLLGMQGILSTRKPDAIFTEFWPEGLNHRQPNGAAAFLNILVGSGFSLRIIDERTKTLLPTDIEMLLTTTIGHEERNLVAFRA